MTRSIALPTNLSRRLVGACLTLGLVTAPMPVFAAPPSTGAAPAAPAEGDAAATPATVGGNVAILKFTGDDYQAGVYREKVRDSLQAQGFTANYIKRSIDETKTTNKCKTLDGACLEKIAAYLNKNTKTAYDYVVWADLPSGAPGTVVVYDIKKKQKIVELDLALSYNDIILVEVNFFQSLKGDSPVLSSIREGLANGPF